MSNTFLSTIFIDQKILITNLSYINLQVGANENNTNSVEASETMSTNSASSPIPYSFNHSSSIDLMNENETKRRHRSSTDDNKMVRISELHFRMAPSLRINFISLSFEYLKIDENFLFRVDLKLLRPPKYHRSLVPLLQL